MALDTHHEADKDKVGLTAELNKSLALAQSKAEEVPALREKTEQLQGQLLQLVGERPIDKGNNN
ncbi:hypothetical protein [Photobacterium chitinilyticum]|uniref:Uncharacterized protein n=1 Tax=Photobacterium chitinilyticum TaxID=2485123 RepID=A0A3S3UHY0_9GAMM|nr:hypothetical protein [Photobacterium chitinilyticum]RWX52862.1 hypothetical protein EDI28_25070 [Photobacterium chitinilyticum]